MRQIFIIFAVAISVTSCSEKKVKKEVLPSDERTKEAMIVVNQKLKRSEADEIKAYYTRRSWPIVQTPTGICYWIYKKGDGKAIENGDVVKMDYTLELINGFKCYTSKEKGIIEFRVGKGDVSGLNEIALLLKHGDKAKVIIPSHLGYGLPGDGDCIPTKATLIYDLTVQ